MALNSSIFIGLGLHAAAHQYADDNLPADEEWSFLQGVLWAVRQIEQREQPILGVALCGKHSFDLPVGTTSLLDSPNCVVCRALTSNKCSSGE